MTIDWNQLVTKEDKLQKHKDSALVTLRGMRADLFYSLAGIQSESLATGNTADALAISGLQKSMRDITATDLSACVTAADVDLALLMAWQASIAGMPVSVLKAFKAVTQ